MKALVGHTGFVGSNLCNQVCFEGLFNSRNIRDIDDKNSDLVIYAGVRAEKYLANLHPEQDRRHIEDTIENIKRIKARKFVLISTIDIYRDPVGVDETTMVDEAGLQPYGLHRRALEKWVEANIADSLIVRLPALYGRNLKKNFLFDMMNLIPTMIKVEKYQELLLKNDFNLNRYYTAQGNDFYKVNELSAKDRETLKQFFQTKDFNALVYNDSRNQYQFYNVKYLWNHIEQALKQGLRLLNITSEPLPVKEIYEYVYHQEFTNIMNSRPARYDIRSIHAGLFSGENGYIFNKQFVLDDIQCFVNEGK
ncbi:MAG TPA: hypothetical protein DDW50_14675 [Firmicutes bacterium]|jgi:nucleoside-diphosphate-sugar epimerase|nr:hypothetical protein [Bacillota bacterium]